jgi:hypothetical protein
MSTDSGSSFDPGSAGRDAGDERILEEDTRRQLGEDAGDGALEDEREREHTHDQVNDAF